MVSKVTDLMERFLHPWMMRVAGVALIVMLGIACGNMFLRVLWLPIKGTYELVGFLGAVVTSFALGYTQSQRGHIAVDIVVNRYPKRLQGMVEALNDLICGLFFGIVAWQVGKWAHTVWRTGEVSETLRIPFHPFTYGVAFGCGVLALVLFLQFLKALIVPLGRVTMGPYRLMMGSLRQRKGLRGGG